MTALRPDTLDDLPAEVSRPSYERSAVTPGSSTSASAASTAPTRRCTSTR